MCIRLQLILSVDDASSAAFHRVNVPRLLMRQLALRRLARHGLGRSILAQIVDVLPLLFSVLGYLSSNGRGRRCSGEIVQLGFQHAVDEVRKRLRDVLGLLLLGLGRRGRGPDGSVGFGRTLAVVVSSTRGRPSGRGCFPGISEFVVQRRLRLRHEVRDVVRHARWVDVTRCCRLFGVRGLVGFDLVRRLQIAVEREVDIVAPAVVRLAQCLLLQLWLFARRGIKLLQYRLVAPAICLVQCLLFQFWLLARRMIKLLQCRLVTPAICLVQRLHLQFWLLARREMNLLIRCPFGIRVRGLLVEVVVVVVAPAVPGRIASRVIRRALALGRGRRLDEAAQALHHEAAAEASSRPPVRNAGGGAVVRVGARSGGPLLLVVHLSQQCRSELVGRAPQQSRRTRLSRRTVATVASLVEGVPRRVVDRRRGR